MVDAIAKKINFPASQPRFGFIHHTDSTKWQYVISLGFSKILKISTECCTNNRQEKFMKLE